MKLDDILTNKFLRLFVPALIVFLIWFFLKDNFSSANSTIASMQCETQREILKENLNAVVVMNYRDSNNRDVRTLKCWSGYDTLISKMFYYETSDFFNYLKPGDHVKKEAGSLKLRVSRDNKDTIHFLKYDCKE